MPIIAPGDSVLVSGVNGFIGIWILRILLERGYNVRGTVRSKEKGVHLKKMFESYEDKFDLAVVSDISEDGAFDEAIKDMDAIIHAASPANAASGDPQHLIRPAVKGILGILNSIPMQGSRIKRVVLLSSTATVSDNRKNRLDEHDWNEQDIQEVESLGEKAHDIAKYRASKTLAEKAAWKFYEENKSKMHWDLTVINPPVVFGPIIHDVKAVAELSSSPSLFCDILFSERSPKDLATRGIVFVDVRDLAEAHVRALERPDAGGERIIVAGGSFALQDMVDAANALSPPPVLGKKLVVGVPGAGSGFTLPTQYDNQKGLRILGLQYRTLEQVINDTLRDFQGKGW